jgi:hypothetical protein
MKGIVFLLNFNERNKMKIIFTTIMLSISLGAFSQQILLEQNIKADTLRPTRGPNLKNYLHGYIGLGFPLATNDAESYTKPGLSSTAEIGVRYKRKLSSHFAVGLDLGVNSTAFKIKQDQWKTVPDTIINDKEKFQISAAVGSAYARINIGRRGNYIGNYLDLGAYGGWNMQKKHKTANENADGEKVRESTTKLKHIENFSYGFLARIGVSRYAITAVYRLSDIFKSSYEMPELPRLIIGFEVGLFK